MRLCGFNPLFVKLSGMRKKEGIREEGKRLEKERGKEDKKYPTMPHVIFSYYRVRKTGRKGQTFSANIDYIQQDVMPSCRRCGARDAIFYDHYERKAKLSSIDGKAYDVKIRAKRYRCPHCGHLFREPIRGLKGSASKSAVLITGDFMRLSLSEFGCFL